MKMQELLTIDPQFKNLIPPLQRTEYLQLEENLLADGCRDPLVVWRGTLIDGHNRYEICTRHSIPFSVKEMNFYCREEAIAWICANQLGRRNLSEETRKYLIGKQYDSEKFVSKIKNPSGFNHYASYNLLFPFICRIVPTISSRRGIDGIPPRRVILSAAAIFAQSA